MPNYFENYANEGNRFLHKVADEMGVDQDSSKPMIVTRAVLHALRDRLPVNENLHLVSQLPMALKGIYVENWRPADSPKDKLDTKAEFYDYVRKQVPVPGNNIPELNDEQGMERAVKSVVNVLKNQVSDGQAVQVMNLLPQDMKTFW